MTKSQLISKISNTGFQKTREWLSEIVEWQLVVHSEVDGGGTVCDTLKHLMSKIEKPFLIINNKEITLSGPILEIEETEEWATAILTIFFDLSKQRQRSENGLSPIQFSELKCYVEIHDIQLSSLEIDVIMDLDQVFLIEMGRQRQIRINNTRSN